MNLGLFHDEETTGVPDYHNPSEGEQQPHIVQIAAKLIDLDTREVLGEMNEYVKPDGWTWDEDDGAFKAHGITVERATAEGIGEVEAVRQFFGLWEQGGDDVLRIAHNEPFDRRIIRIATKRYPELAEYEGPWHSLPKNRSWCTMYKTTKTVGIPPTIAMRKSGRHFNKNPSLQEAYEFFMHEPMENAHDAMADVCACIEVYFAFKELTA